MKIPVLLLTLWLFSFKTFAQPLQVVQRFIAVNDYRSAKEKIDSLLHDETYRKQAAPWFYRAKVYTEVVRRLDTANSALLVQALDSYKKYQELDPGNSLMGVENNVGLFQLYDLGYNTGVEYYNRQAYGQAYPFFKIALETETYIFRKKFSFNGKQFPAVDTQLVSLTGFSAWLGGLENESIPYLEKLADMDLSDEAYKGVYTILYQYHQKYQNKEKSSKYLAAGRKIFDDEPYWVKVELGNPASVMDRLARYEEMIRKYPSGYYLRKRYAAEIFSYLYEGEKPADYTARQQKLQKLLAELIKQDSTDAFSRFILSQHLVNTYYDLEERYMGLDEGAEKKSLQEKMQARNEEHLTASLKAFELYQCHSNPRQEDKTRCRQLIQDIIAAYKRNKNQAKVEEYQQLMKSY